MNLEEILQLRPNTFSSPYMTMDFAESNQPTVLYAHKSFAFQFHLLLATSKSVFGKSFFLPLLAISPKSKDRDVIDFNFTKRIHCNYPLSESMLPQKIDL